MGSSFPDQEANLCPLYWKADSQLWTTREILRGCYLYSAWIEYGSWQGILLQQVVVPLCLVSLATSCEGRTHFSSSLCISPSCVSWNNGEQLFSPPCESVPKFVTPLIHPVIFIMGWFPDALPSWFAFIICHPGNRSMVDLAQSLWLPSAPSLAGWAAVTIKWQWHKSSGGSTPKTISLQLQPQKPAPHIYAWHLVKQWCKLNVNSKCIIIYLCLDLVRGLINEDLIKQSLHSNWLQLELPIKGKPQIPCCCPLVLSTHNFSSKAFSLHLIMVRSWSYLF